MAQLQQNLCGVPKKGASQPFFGTFVPLWVSHKLKTNPILFFFFSVFFRKSRGGKRQENRFHSICEVCPSHLSFAKPAFLCAEEMKPLFLKVWGCETAQHFVRWPSPFGMAMRGRGSLRSPVFVFRSPFLFEKIRHQSRDFPSFFWTEKSGFFDLPESRTQILFRMGHQRFTGYFLMM